MKGVTVEFKNKPNEDGSTSNHLIADCLIGQNGSPTGSRPQIIVHIPKTDDTDVTGAWINYRGGSYHVIGVTVPGIQENIPTRWNRYVVAEKIY